MPQIQNRKLDIKQIKEKALAECTVTCQIVFSPDELQFMNNNPLMKFNLKCELWGEDSGFEGGDKLLWTFDGVFSFPDSTPTKTENAQFFVVLGDDVLDEDKLFNKQDEIYGKLILTHKLFQTVSRKTNIAKIYA